ncbi:MAG: hypothetical protein II973_13395 [Spirochaetaceae bacterium]|nr:hypothetical protein [Spirochaetaceae bacterium]
MNQDQVKEILLKIEDTELDFSVTFTGKESKKVNGLYKPDTHEILLHTKNFKTDNQLIYTAIHEYAHHLIAEQDPLKCSGRAHTNEFWAKFHELLEKAEQQGLYVLGLENAPELEALTEDLRKNYLEANGQLMIEFGKKLSKAYELCESAGIRYEDYLDRVLKLPRAAAQSISKVSKAEPAAALGFDNMKLVASLPASKQKEAESELLAGKTPDTVRFMMKKKSEETDKKQALEREKKRIEKTIAQLSQRLELIEENLASL